MNTAPDRDGLSAIPLRAVAVVIGFLGLLPAANWFGDGVPVPWWSAAIRPWLLWSIPVLGAAFGLASLDARCDAAIDRANRWILAPSARAFSVGVFGLTCALAAMFAWYCFHGRMIVGDEMAQRFQARVLLSGRLAAVPEEHMEFFNSVEALDADGRWFSQFPIGGALTLALGVALHAVWLVNPLLAGWTTTSVYRFARGATDELFARWTALLFSLSPYVLFMAASQLNHVPALACIMWGISALPAWGSSSDPRVVRRASCVIGFAFACAATVRPYDAAVCAAVVGIFQLTSPRAARLPWTTFAWQIGAGMIPLALLFFVNWRTTGSPMLFGYDALNGPMHRPGFHLDPRGLPHTPARGVYLASAYLMRLNVSPFEWPLPALAFVLTGMALRPTRSSWDYLFAGILVALVGGYALYWHEGFFMSGPRFMFSAMPAIVWLAARGVRAAAQSAPTAAVRRAVYLVVPICVAFTWLAPGSHRRVFGVWMVASLQHQQHTTPRPDPVAEARTLRLDHALVFVRESWHTSLASRIRALGSPPLATEAFIPQVDACVLQRALDAVPVDADPRQALAFVLQQADSGGLPVPANNALDQNRRVSLVKDRPITPECAAELKADERPGVSLALLLPDAEFERDGRLGGKVVWARELGPRDTLLRARFGDRQWYRYVPDAPTVAERFVRIEP